ncbi:ROK family protein [Ktedonobacter robiniae]|uniref:Sugar kinase n=1 Tax=Ktedonobacter robiniae TaxID=2778365 RepID=A0ABQ3V4H4_9CHLR|nr:ROK family protein [Ktedonobacter robiniae]GHO60079.1 sugar kinase [Ktedonobacter robiniae]
MNTVAPVDRKVMREVNQNTLLNLVRMHAPISRTQLVTLSGLSVGTVVGITTELMGQQLVIERGVAASSLGRKAGLLQIDPHGRYVLGVALMEADEIVVVLLNLLGEIIYSCSKHVSELALSAIMQAVEETLSKNGIEREKVLGLGCGLPGFVDMQTGYSIKNGIHNWHHLAIHEPLERALHLPVFIDNVVNCLAHYEHLYGKRQSYQHLLVVTLGRGVGLAMVIRGQVYRGARGSGAEFGHTLCIPGGRRCECGNYGCLEAYLSDHGLLTSYHELRQQYPGDPSLPAGLSLTEIHERAVQGHPALRQLFREAGQLLGRGLANLINLLNPEYILLTGAYVAPDHLLFASLQDTINEHTFSELAQQVQIVIEPETGDRWAQGAGSLVLHHFFKAPLQSGV